MGTTSSTHDQPSSPRPHHQSDVLLDVDRLASVQEESHVSYANAHENTQAPATSNCTTPQSSTSTDESRAGIKGCIRFAHKSVQEVFLIIQTLEKQWDERIRTEERGGHNEENISDIQTLINTIGKTSKGIDEIAAKEIFRYFAAAAIYARAIQYSQRQYSQSNSYNDFQVDPRSASEVTLTYLNGLAGDAIKCLQENLPEGGKTLKDIQGDLAVLRCTGNIPFLQVISTDDKMVSLRRGFELAKRQNEETKQVLNADQKLFHFPARMYLNGVLQTGGTKDETLKDIFNKSSYVDNLLDKYISWIHVSLPDEENKKTLYEIDFMDTKIACDSNKSFIKEKRLQALAGRKRTGWNRRDAKTATSMGNTDIERNDKFTQKDIIISYLSIVLFNEYPDITSSDYDWQAIEDWSRDRIMDFAESRPRYSEEERQCGRNPMYVGFSFSTILDGGYADQNIVNGSTNLLLLALTRGYVELVKHHMKIEGYLTEKPNPPSITLVPRKRTRNKYFIGATSKGITVETKFPWKLLFLSILGVIILIAYALGVGTTNDNTVEFAASLVSLFSILTGAVLLLTKCTYQNWELTEMVHRRRHAQRMSELCKALPNAEKDAIEIFCQLDNPENVFSKWRSCAFANEGKGDFEIDLPIKVRDLEKAGFTFGVDYHGEPIMCNTHGKVRKISFPDMKKDDEVATWWATRDRGNTMQGEKNSGQSNNFLSEPIQDMRRGLGHKTKDAGDKEEEEEEEFLHVGETHDLQLRLMYCLPLRDLIVGSGHHRDEDESLVSFTDS